MKHFVIQSPDGAEKQVVQSLDGYDGWEVLGEADRGPEDDEEWDPQAKRWLVNYARRAAKTRWAAARDPEKLLVRIEALERRLTEVEGKL